MDIAVLVLFIGLLIFAAHFFAWIFSFTNVPNVLLLMLVGIVLGPVTGLLRPDFFGEAGSLFSTIVLAVILFEGGIGLRWDMLVSSWKSSLGLTLLNFFAVTFGIALLMWQLSDLGFLLSLMLGVIVAGPSSVVALPILDKLRVLPRVRTIVFLEAVITDVLSILLTFALLRALEAGSFSVVGVLFNVVGSFAISAFVGAGTALMWSVLLNGVRRMKNSVFSTPAFVFILFGLMELAGGSGPVAAFAFGVMMGNIGFFKLYLERSHMFLHRILQPMALSEIERSFFEEVAFLLETFFFVFVGLSLQFGDRALVIWGVLLVLYMFLVRIPVVRFTIPASIPVSDTAMLSVLTPIGLAAVVLAGLPAQYGILGGSFIQEVVYVMIFVSVIATSLFLFLVSKTPVGKIYRILVRSSRAVANYSPSFVKK